MLGLLILQTSIGVIFGASIGATITVQIISFSIDQYILPVISLGVFLKLFAKKSNLKTFGSILIGFGILFLGILIMKESIEPFKNSLTFKTYINLITKNSMNIMYALLLSTLITAIIQSSGALLGLLIAFSMSGLINDIHVAIPIILGAKIGTCVTAFFASIKANRNAKRVVLANFIFHISAALLTLMFLKPFISFISFLSLDITRQIANTHTFISIFTSIIFIPISTKLLNLLKILIPVKETEEELNFFDIKLLQAPNQAIKSIKKAILKMSKFCYDMLKTSLLCSTEDMKKEKIYSVYRKENYINTLQESISVFIMKLSKLELSSYQSMILNSYKEITNDLERIGDLSENIIDNLKHIKNLKFKSTTLKTLENLRIDTINLFLNTFKSFKDSDFFLSKGILEHKKEDKSYLKTCSKKINEDINKNKIPLDEGIVTIDIIYNVERIHYHLRRILFSNIRINSFNSKDKLND
jgi:phosphate:Na+ symporter